MHHSSTPTHLSIHPSKPLAISTSASESVLWNTEEWERIRVLVGPGTGVQQTSFSPDGVCIIAAFSDGSIFFWTIDSFSLLWKISLDQIAGPDTEIFDELSKHLSYPRINHFGVSNSGEFFAYGGL